MKQFDEGDKERQWGGPKVRPSWCDPARAFPGREGDVVVAEVVPCRARPRQISTCATTSPVRRMARGLRVAAGTRREFPRS